MNLSPFVGRQKELALLDSMWNTSKATMFILYGRRRVGKTRLLTHWLQQHGGRGIYWVAEPTSALDQLRSFSQALYNYSTPDTPAPLDFSYANWEQALRQVSMMAAHQRMALFIDELPYLIDVNPSFAGILQKSWDHWLSKSNLILALSGSQMGLMRKMLAYDAPLHGRASAQIKLPPLPFSATQKFFPDYTVADRVALYSIWGGVPAYWERLDPDRTVLENIRSQLLPANSLMQEEPRTLLQDFISDPHNYVGIMRAMAGGAHTISRISTRTGLARGHTSKYLSVLRNTGFVTREVPVTEDPAKSRRGRYFITDPFLRFHYRFLSAYQAKLALGEQTQMMENIANKLPDFIEQSTWRELCREWVLRASANNEIPASIEFVGGVWSRSQYIPVAAINRQTRDVVIGGLFWQDKLASAEQLQAIINLIDTFLPDKGEWNVSLINFAATGWSMSARTMADLVRPTGKIGKNSRLTAFLLLDLAQVDADLARWHGESMPDYLS